MATLLITSQPPLILCGPQIDLILTMSKFWSPNLHSLSPYEPGEQPQQSNLIKLNTNENPYGPSPKALAAIHTAASDELRLYPNPDSQALKDAVADYYKLSAEQVFIGNGSDEILAHCFYGLLKQAEPLLFPAITYSFYPVYCAVYDIDYRTIPLREDFTIAVDDYRQPNGGIIIPNPNAPTGQLLSREQIAQLAADNPERVVVIDEAYIDFGGDTAVPLVADHPNLLVIQTLSKSRSLAGLRVGFAIGNPELIAGLDRVKNSFNSYPLDRLAVAGAVAAMADREYFEATRQKVIASRERLQAALAELGFRSLPSAANFVLTEHPRHAASELAQQLRARNIIVRHFKQPEIENFLRITIGSDDQIDALVTALRELV